MSLKKVAALMHFEAKVRSKSHRKWCGLKLKLLYRIDDIVLIIARVDVAPSEEDVKICESNFFFGLPLSNKVRTGKQVYVAIKRESLFGKKYFMGAEVKTTNLD